MHTRDVLSEIPLMLRDISCRQHHFFMSVIYFHRIAR